VNKIVKFFLSIFVSSSILMTGLVHPVYAMLPVKPLNRCSFVYVEDLSYLSSGQIQNLTKEILKNNVSSYERWSKLAIVQLAKKRIYTKIAELCANPGSCTDKAIARTVESEIVSTFQELKEIKSKIKKLKGVAMLVGASIGVAIASQYMKSHIPSDTRWVAEFVTIISSIAIYKLGAPLFGYFADVVYRGAFRMSEGKSFIRKQDELHHLIDQFQFLQEKMSPYQQQEANRMNVLLNTLEVGFNAAVESILSPDPAKGGIDRGVARIATLIIKMRRFFPEVNPDQDIDVVRTVDMLLKDQINMDTVNRDLLAKKTMEKIEQYDPASKDPEVYKRYYETVKRWYGVVQ